MTASQQPGYGRHARVDEPDGGPPPAPSSVPAPAPRSTPVSGSVPPQRPSPDAAARPRSVGEYVARMRVTGPAEAGFGEWPYGARRPEPDEGEPAGPNPYLPCDDESPEVRLAPGGLPGMLALLAGLAGLGLALFPVIATVAWPLTILGLVLGVVGLRRARTGAARNSVIAVTGVVLSAAGLALCVAWLSMFALAGVGAAGAGPDQRSVPAVVR